MCSSDLWQMSGMVGTGSNDIVVEDVFVPDCLRQNLSEMRAGNSPGAQYHQTPTYRMPMLPVLGLTATAPAVGCAKQTVARFKERLQERTVYGTQDKQSERALAQSRLAHLTVRANTIETTLHQIANDVTAWGESGELCTDSERAELRVRIGHVVRESRNIVREVVEVSGAHAHNLSNPFGRALRDQAERDAVFAALLGDAAKDGSDRIAIGILLVRNVAMGFLAHEQDRRCTLLAAPDGEVEDQSAEHGNHRRGNVRGDARHIDDRNRLAVGWHAEDLGDEIGHRVGHQPDCPG